MPAVNSPQSADVVFRGLLVRRAKSLGRSALIGLNDSWLVELVVKEGKLSQQLGVALVPRAQAQVLLKLSAMGFPRPTWGVQRAVWHVAQMLQEHNPQLRILWMSMGASEDDPEDIQAQSGRRGASKPASLASES